MNRINGTRFLSQDELAKQLQEIDLTASEYPVGGVPLLVRENKAFVDGSDSHTIIFGATGSKKTRMFAMPSIGIFAGAGESFVVTDPKGELYERTAADVINRNYQVFCLNLRNMRKGVTWNPLRLPYEYYHRGRKTKALEFVNQLATMIIDRASSEELFWVHTSVDVLTGLILILFENCSKAECNLKSLMDLWTEYQTGSKKFIRTIKERYKGHMIYQKLSVLDNNSDKTVGSIEAVVTMGFNKLMINEELVCFLSQEGIQLQQMSEKKTAIYLVIPDENKSYHFIVSLFLEQLYEELIRSAQGKPNCSLETRMNFLVDEFANIPKIENMESMITASRSRNIRFHLIVQSMKQLRQKYQDIADVICSNCNNWIYLYSKEYQLLKEISLLCGEVIYDNNMRMPLFSEFDLQHLSKEEGEALVLAGRNYPCLSNMADIDDYPFAEGKLPMLTTPQWQPISIYQFGDRNESQYTYPIEKIKLWNYEEEDEGEQRWLVAVGPEGIIFGEKRVSAKSIKNGSAIKKMAQELNQKLKVETAWLRWYSADVEAYWKYSDKIVMYQELVFLTMDEVGKDLFRREKGIEEDDEFVASQEWEYLIELYRYNGREWEFKASITVPYYPGVVGERYAQRYMFRFANLALKGTRYAEFVWEQYWDNMCFSEFPYFRKREKMDDMMEVRYRRKKIKDAE